MKAFFAQWKRDMASLRSLLWVWAICVAFIVTVGFGSRLSYFQPAAAHGPMPDPAAVLIPIISLTVLGILSFVVQGLLLLLLVSGLVHGDPLTEPDAFWRTRPIPRLILLAEKMAFVLLLTAGSILTGAAMHSGNPVLTAADLHWVVFVAGLMAFAAVTSSFPQIIVNVLGLALGGVIAAIVLGHFTFSMHGSPPNLELAQSAQLTDNSASPWIAIFTLAGFLAAIVCQYLTSRTKLSRAILFAIFFITTLWQSR